MWVLSGCCQTHASACHAVHTHPAGTHVCAHRHVPSPTRTHGLHAQPTHTHADTRVRGKEQPPTPRSHMCSHQHSCSTGQTRAHTDMRAHTRTRMHARFHTNTRAPTCLHMRVHIRTHIHTPANTPSTAQPPPSRSPSPKCPESAPGPAPPRRQRALRGGAGGLGPGRNLPGEAAMCQRCFGCGQKIQLRAAGFRPLASRNLGKARGQGIDGHDLNDRGAALLRNDNVLL